MMIQHVEVLVVGGGYAGVMAANRLARSGAVTVTLINPRPHFIERIRLHQHAAGSHPAVVKYRRVLAGKVHLVVDTVATLDRANRRVRLVDGRSLAYDYLVYAVGSGSAEPDVPGAAEFAHRCSLWEEARRLRAHLDEVPLTAPVTVVGAGPTGIETAAELAETGRAVTLICGDVLGPYLHPRVRDALRVALDRLGVRILEGSGTTVTGVSAGSVRLRDGRERPSEITVWTAGFSVPGLAAESGLSTDGLGRLRTDETLTSIDDDRIVAAGDCAAPSGRPLRMSCQAAIPLGSHAADTVLRRIGGVEPGPVDVPFVGQALSLGRRSGLIQFARRDDSPVRWSLGGRGAAVVKELVCRGTIRLIASGRYGSVSLRWPGPHTMRKAFDEPGSLYHPSRSVVHGRVRDARGHS